MTFYSKARKKSVILIYAGKAIKFSYETNREVSKIDLLYLFSNQEETETRVFLYSAYAADKEFQDISIHNPESDIFFILLHFARAIKATLHFDTGNGNKRKLMKILPRDAVQPFWRCMHSRIAVQQVLLKESTKLNQERY